jgi:hypothetical protein
LRRCNGQWRIGDSMRVPYDRDCGICMSTLAHVNSKICVDMRN